MSNKFIIVMFFIASFFISCGEKSFNYSVGKMESNQFQLDRGIDSIRLNWQSLLKNNKIKGTLSKFEIKKDRDDVNKKDYYVLIGYSQNDSIKVASLLKKRNKKFYFYKDPHRIVICFGCKESFPKYQFDKWGWSCDTKEINEDCKKSSIVKF